MNKELFLQPREKLERLGAEALDNSELLAILLRTGLPGKPVTELAKEILRQYQDNLQLLCTAEPSELKKIKGLGKVKILELTAAFTLSRRLSQEKMFQRPPMNNPDRIAELMYPLYQNATQEILSVLLLDNQCNLIRNVEVSRGLVDRSYVHPREVFRPAIREACSSIIVCHNHPSGNVTPSQPDIRATRRLAQCGELLGIPLTDHLILGSMRIPGKINFFSFRANGYLSASPSSQKTDF